MDMKPDWERLAELDLSDLHVGDWFIYCPTCLERFEANVAIAHTSRCDRCGGARHKVQITSQEDLVTHARLRREERDV
jgi:PHP family Zn ribbon phosphoesterase